LDLEKKLKATLRKKSFWDSEVRQLRGQLRDSYEALLFLDLNFAAANDVEQVLWKSVFYRPIEEFRSRVKEAEKAGQAGAEQLPKVGGAFSRFLEDASGFYRGLVMQLQGSYGDVGVKLEMPSGAAKKAAARATDQEMGSSAPRDVRPSIHRCLIYLGDLARYQAQLGQQLASAATRAAAAAGTSNALTTATAASRTEWNRAAQFYKLAARCLPRSAPSAPGRS